MKLTGKSALVTGSSQGIGEAVAIRLAQDGANVAVNYHTHPDKANRVVDKIKSLGRTSFAIGADISTIEGIRTLIQGAIDKLGKLDILINNAGIERNVNFHNVTESDYDRVLAVNLKGPFFTSQIFVHHLMETKRPGRIINISSVHEQLPFPHFTPYAISKGGLMMLTRTLAIELAPLGITVNSVAPGAIETPINKDLLSNHDKLKNVLKNIPLNRLGKSEDVASAVAFLVSDDADYITGTTLFVDGGLLWNYQEQ